MRLLFLATICLLTSTDIFAQFDTYLVTFHNKGDSPYSISQPQEYLSQRAIDRRVRYGINIDSLDLPVTPSYIDSIKLLGNVDILGTSKWLNQVAIKTTDANKIAEITAFPFVNTVNTIAPRANGYQQTNNKFNHFEPVEPSLFYRNASIESDTFSYGSSSAQVKIHRADFLHRWGFTGRGMQLAMMDAGYYHYQTLSAFDSLRIDNRILGTWDFVEQNESVNEDYYHGMQCLSTIAANLPEEFVGTAPHASFYLYRTEDVASEFPIEEHYLAAGFERADSVGADVTSTSLGYTQFSEGQFNYTYEDMNGHTTMAARALNIGAQKGMLMVVGAGNEGNSPWHYISTPGDADSALTVGAVDTTGTPGNFSSYGPAFGGNIKPTLAAVGWNAIVSNTSNGKPMFSSGTSFACPNLAGVATCLWQAFPEGNQHTIIHTLIAAATKANNPDNRIGYGIPDVRDAFVRLQKAGYSQSISEQECIITINLHVKIMTGMKIIIERKTANEFIYSPLTELSTQNNFDFHLLNTTDDLSNTPEGLIKYRMTMILGTDTTYTLDSLSIQHIDNCHPIIPETDGFVLSPNPANSQVKLTIQSVQGGKYFYGLYNILGQQLLQNSITVQPGSTHLFVPLVKYANGIYFFRVLDNKKKRIGTIPFLIKP